MLECMNMSVYKKDMNIYCSFKIPFINSLIYFSTKYSKSNILEALRKASTRYYRILYNKRGHGDIENMFELETNLSLIITV